MMTFGCVMLIDGFIFAIYYVTVDRLGFHFLKKWKNMYYNVLFLYLPE